ncbi:MAG TPA: type II toxin-antitoxin system VapC family toxin [Rubrivivax sp.]|nr:type II toxin-antitoxin system VapC family toxin [Rubrivivax sp.]
MKLLLDTHALLWWLLDDADLPATARRAIARAEVVRVSAASIWEVAIKQRLGKLPELALAVAELPALVRQSGFLPLPVDERHAAAVASLPLRHRDPFDHLLIAQAQIEGLTLVSRDAQLADYGVALRW